ncbi:MAG: magnesium/cobalt transporter CorA [Chlorobiaceae bacterium]|nr:magnesium/cobalt transporter CorA [Chlorobiaceae bacterium]
MKKNRNRGRQGKPLARPVRLKTAKLLDSRIKTIGQPPGSLIPIGRQQIERTQITLIAFDESQVVTRQFDDLDEYLSFKEKYRVVWVDICGLHDPLLIEQVGQVFGIDTLTLEDVLHTGQRAKVEDFEQYLYIVLQMLEYSQAEGGISREQLSIVIGKDYVVTFQEKPGDMFGYVRQRIANAGSKVRKLGADYLAYTLIDAVVDHYLTILEEVENTIDQLESALLENYSRETFESIYSLKRELIILRKSVWPLREAIGCVTRDDIQVIGDSVDPYYRDIYDHIILVIDTVEVFRDIVTGMQETYLASVNNRMNEVMKFLTMIATIFMPLSFIAGLYGMNFHYMPELGWRWGYYAVLGVMFLIFGGMVLFYRSRKWY